VLSCSLEEGGLHVVFSAAPAEISIHKAFSMTEDGQALEGRFVFEGENLWFYPVNGIGENREYMVIIGVIAEDHRGNSLAEEYRRDFFTRAEREAPGIEAVIPAEGSTLTQTPAEIRLSFSEAVDPPSLEEAMKISPAFPYVLQWEADYRELLIRPLKPLDFGKRYTISISTALRDRSRNNMVLPFTSSFFLEGGRFSPCFSLEWAGATGTGPLSPDVVNRGLPPDAELQIRFDMEVETEMLAGFVELQPSLGISITTERGSRSEAAIHVARQPEWGETCTLIIRKGITAIRGGKTTEDLAYSLVFDAAECMPPEFIKGFFRDSGQVLSQETDFDYLNLDVLEFPPTQTAVAADMCLVFTIPVAASSLSLSSAMTAFSITPSNSCAYISIKTLKILDEDAYRLSGFNDPLLEAGTGKKLCALIYGLEIENTENQGLIVFSIASSLEDSLGNQLGEDIKITWNKQ
jgi:hypothetical protein